MCATKKLQPDARCPDYSHAVPRLRTVGRMSALGHNCGHGDRSGRMYAKCQYRTFGKNLICQLFDDFVDTGAPTAERRLLAVPDWPTICFSNCSRRSLAAPHHAPVRGSSLADRCQLVTDVSVPRTLRFGSSADILRCGTHVRFTPESGHVRCKNECPLWARSGHGLAYSITSSAIESTPGGTSMPSARAV